MNRALLAELQSQRAYPSITLLFNTTSGAPFSPAQVANAAHLADQADRRLGGEIDDDLRKSLVETIVELLHDSATDNAGHALAVCVSPQYSAAIRLGRRVNERVIIDETFATRDVVADLNRTALYRLITVSGHTTRLLIGDRQRLVEEQSEHWPLTREPEQNLASWTRAVMHALRREHAQLALPTVVAGVERSVRQVLSIAEFGTIGAIPGNHDRVSEVDLHHKAWPLVTDWLCADRNRAMEQLDNARSQRRYAGGIHEIWPLANEARIELLVVEDGYALPVRVDGDHLQPVTDAEAPGVVDDIIDEVIEIVIRNGGNAVIVADGDLIERGHIAAILRY